VDPCRPEAAVFQPIALWNKDPGGEEEQERGERREPTEVHFICIALNHSYCLKGLYRPYDYGAM